MSDRGLLPKEALRSEGRDAPSTVWLPISDSHW